MCGTCGFCNKNFDIASIEEHIKFHVNAGDHESNKRHIYWFENNKLRKANVAQEGGKNSLVCNPFGPQKNQE